jgi:hypothetical protein
MRPSRLLLLAILAALPSLAGAADVGVSINIGEPGFYGQINLGNAPRPEVIYPEPVFVEPVAPGIRVEPLYLRVPPGHEKHWAKYCREYHACNRPVYFVREDWYQRTYPERRHERGEAERHERHEEAEHREHHDEREHERDHEHRDN